MKLPACKKLKINIFLWERLSGLFFLLLIILFLPVQNVYSFKKFTEDFIPSEKLILPAAAPYPVNLKNNPVPEISAEAVKIIDVHSGAILFSKNPQNILYPASTTKIMTTLVALDYFKLTDILIVNTIDIEGQKMNLEKDEMISFENLLYGILVHSANDAAYAIAENYPGGVSAFIQKMNQKAENLNLTDTNFTNSIGLDNENHYSTVADLAKLTLIALKNPLIAKIVATSQITVSDKFFQKTHLLKNINELLGKVPGVSGFKTGYTQKAGQALITTVERNNHTVLIVILNSQDRFGETEKLLNWVFDSFIWKDFSYPK